MLNRLYSSIISHFLRTIRWVDRLFYSNLATYILICMQVAYLFRIICCTFADVYETGQDHISSNVHLQRCVTPSARTARLDIRTDVAARRDSSAGRLQHRRHHAGAARVCRPCARGRGDAHRSEHGTDGHQRQLLLCHAAGGGRTDTRTTSGCLPNWRSSATL